MEADSFSLALWIAAILVVVGMFQFEATKGTDVLFRHSLYQLQYCQMSLPPTCDGDLFLTYLFQGIDLHEVQKLRLLAYTFYFVCVRQFQIFPRIVSTSRTIRYR